MKSRPILRPRLLEKEDIGKFHGTAKIAVFVAIALEHLTKWTPGELYAACQKHEYKTSLPALYRALMQLREQGIIQVDVPDSFLSLRQRLQEITASGGELPDGKPLSAIYSFTPSGSILLRSFEASLKLRAYKPGSVYEPNELVREMYKNVVEEVNAEQQREEESGARARPHLLKYK